MEWHCSYSPRNQEEQKLLQKPHLLTSGSEFYERICNQSGGITIKGTIILTDGMVRYIDCINCIRVFGNSKCWSERNRRNCLVRRGWDWRPDRKLNERRILDAEWTNREDVP